MRGLTIGQAAALAGVTIKTVRHYHKHGLLPEPRRDSSGYRRYGSEDLLRLVQVRTLAGAGVALADVSDLLDADPEGFAQALVDVEQRLTERIDELIERRDTLRKLATGDRLLLPERACAFLDRAPGLGFTADEIETAREAFLLVRALVPESFDEYLDQVERGLENPRYLELTQLSMRTGDWDPDDPRLEQLAEDLVELLKIDPTLLPSLPGLRDREDGAARHRVLTSHRKAERPAWTRLTALIEQKMRAAGLDI
jgi:DNA-binding transcriptional MerR regulator